MCVQILQNHVERKDARITGILDLLNRFFTYLIFGHEQRPSELETRWRAV